MLSVEDLAKRLNVTPKVIYNLRYKGQGPPAHRIGRELRFNEADVDQWLADRRDNGGPRAA